MNSSPRRYCVNGDGWRVLVGLTFQETLEFEALDALPTGHEAWREQATDARQQRWAELYAKHETAWREWKVAQKGSRQDWVRLDGGMISG